MSRTLTSSCEESLSTGRRNKKEEGGYRRREGGGTRRREDTGGGTRSFCSGLQILRDMMGQKSATELSQ